MSDQLTAKIYRHALVNILDGAIKTLREREAVISATYDAAYEKAISECLQRKRWWFGRYWTRKEAKSYMLEGYQLCHLEGYWELRRATQNAEYAEELRESVVSNHLYDICLPKSDILFLKEWLVSGSVVDD